MQKIRLSALAMASVLVVPNSFAQFADAVVAYVPGTGVSASCTNPAAALGEPSRVTPGPWGGPVDPFSPAWQGAFLSRSNWNYLLEASENLLSWTNVTPAIPGTGQATSLADINAASFGKRFYRINASPNF